MRAGIGLDIGSTAVRVAAVRSTKSGPVLLKYASTTLQGDIVKAYGRYDCVTKMLNAK